ncbi:HAD family hydrolase [Liquorilactobacillus capillatus]|uniref:Phosphatase n=1 Tax=Liquorilactobacillus capillatus DSM 19910 TaxID=1423731 RepID=A0A0R1M6B8_9LACO|nr:HAD family hydrolase [Liquorilactobacillus capillatus]KRL01108.1 phosphatase [Liquorilactobacillus capillatus DSM 19910]
MENYIFDFDGTLANSGKTAVLATQAAFRDFEMSLPTTSTVKYYMGVPIEVSFKKMADRKLADNEFDELLKDFRTHYQVLETANLTLFPGIESVLERLFTSNKKMFVLSSKHSSALNRNLEQLNILQYFQATCGSDQVEHYKPAPDGIYHLVGKYQLHKSKTIMIGDAIYDLQMGLAAEVSTCGVTWGAHASNLLANENPTYLINDVQSLLDL